MLASGDSTGAAEQRVQRPCVLTGLARAQNSEAWKPLTREPEVSAVRTLSLASIGPLFLSPHCLPAWP